VSKQAAGAVPGYEASVNQLFSAELHQRLARTGAQVFLEGSRFTTQELFALPRALAGGPQAEAR